jgi:hypothetical protein
VSTAAVTAEEAAQSFFISYLILSGEMPKEDYKTGSDLFSSFPHPAQSVIYNHLPINPL